MPVKLFVFNPYPAIGGGDTTLNRFIKNINLNKFDVYYFSLKKVKVRFKKIKYIQLKSQSTFKAIFEIKKILKKFEDQKKIFFSMQYFVNSLILLLLKNIKNIKFFIYEINHISELDFFSSFKDFFKKKIIKNLIKNYYSRADIICGNCKELSRDLSILINRNVKTIYNPCFTGLKKRVTKKKNKHFSILNIGRLEMQKDHFTLLKAINLSKFKKKIHLTIVGYGSNKVGLEKFAKLNEINLKIFTKKEKLINFYKKNDLFVFTSIYEGLPTVMVEAASYRLPIISSNFKSGSKEILNNGKGGFLFNKKNYKELSKLIDAFCLEPKFFLEKENKCSKKLYRFSYKKNSLLFNKTLESLI